MDILAGLKDKLRFIERFYEAASQPFREAKRQIDAGEPPFSPRPFDPDTVDGEPEFLDEWIEADESLNLVGQAALSLVQAALKEYIDAYVLLQKPTTEIKSKGNNWFQRRKTYFLQAYGVNWDESPVPLDQLEEINLARNDTHHREALFGAFGMTRVQGGKHRHRFPTGLFVHEIDKQLAQEDHDGSLGRIYVTKENLLEAIRRVEKFCEFLEAKRPY